MRRRRTPGPAGAGDPGAPVPRRRRGLLGAVGRSLPAKVFLLVAGVLTACCLAVYAVVAAAFPGGYDDFSAARAASDLDVLAEGLSAHASTDAVVDDLVYEYCIRNGALAVLTVAGRERTYGTVASAASTVASAADDGAPDTEGARATAFTVASGVVFSDGVEGFLYATEADSPHGQILVTFRALFPPVLAAVLAAAALCAWLCSRYVARPVVAVSAVAERMSELDMTWRCDEGRADEVGTLAASLNSMAARLDAALTDLRAANDRLAREVETTKALEAQRREFFAAASHELKTPIAIVRAQVEGMLLGIGGYADHAACLPRTLGAVERMQDLVQELLDVVRMDAARPDARTPVDMRELVARVVEEARPLAGERGVELELRDGSGEGPVAVAADAALLKRALANVVGNAAAYAPAGSTAAVALRAGGLTVENALERPIDPADAARLCEPFFRPDASRSAMTGGSGLGLYIAAGVFDAHGWRHGIAVGDGRFAFTVTWGDGADDGAGA